jgi:hypothetical protein
MGRLETKFQTHLIKRIEKEILPGSIVIKNDSGYQQGIPDLSVFWHDRWAWLEVKRSWDSDEEPNQRYFVEWANRYAYGAFIFPENEEEVLRELQQAFRASRKARVPQR